MESLNDIIEERNKSRMHKHQHNVNYQNILLNTPKILRIQNSIDDDEAAVLIEKINMIQITNNDPNSRASLPSHAVTPIDEMVMRNEDEEEKKDGILRMSPRSQTKFFESLNKIYEEQDAAGAWRRRGQENSLSPEYTIVSAIDDSCVLFAVKEN